MVLSLLFVPVLIVPAQTDPSGAVIPNVLVTATNSATLAEFAMHTDMAGEYAFSTLPAGLYTVRFEAPGFQVTTIDQVHVLAPDTTELDLKLQVGTVSEAVMVNASAVVLNTESASVSVVNLGRAGGVPGGVRGLVALKPGLTAPPPPGLGTPRLREYFPETLLWRPEILTSSDGHATIRFPVADSINAWQLSVAASTLHGNVGAGAAGFRTMLPFFAALEPPQVLTVGDRITLPVALRNYLDHPVSVRSELTAQDWFHLDRAPARTEVPAQGSASAAVTLTATAPSRTANSASRPILMAKQAMRSNGRY